MVRLFFILFLGLLFSCKGEKTNEQDICTLTSTGNIKSFELDSDVKYNAFYLYTFRDCEDQEYLSFLNYQTNQILFYDLKTSKFLFKIELASEGPHGVVRPSGYYIKDFDNIFVSSYAYEGLIKVDTLGHIVQKIPYGETAEGYRVLPSYTPSSHPYIAPIFVDGKMFITQQGVERFHPIEKTPLSVTIDTVSKVISGTPLTYDILDDDEQGTEDLRFSRIYDGRQFVYSFYVNEDIVVTPINHIDYKVVKVKSRFINSATEVQKKGEQGPRSNLEVARYGDIVYDPYREVYYRFAYHYSELDSKKNWRGNAVFGRKKFSVIILNKDFEIIGETLFPEAVYNSYVFFVHKEGLYISRDYQINYDQSEDYMTFELFSLESKV